MAPIATHSYGSAVYTGAALGLPELRYCQAALIFNTQPAVWIHDSWLRLLPQADLLQRLRTVPQAAPWLSAHLLRSFGLEQHYCDDFANPWARLALLDGSTLQSLFLHLGLTLRHHALTHDLSGVQLRRLKPVLTVAEWEFLLRHVPLLGSIPPCKFDEPATDNLRTRFTLLGGRFCTLHLPQFGAAILQRLLLKLPATWSAILNTPPNLASADEMPPLLRKLLKTLLPTCTLFT